MCLLLQPRSPIAMADQSIFFNAIPHHWSRTLRQLSEIRNLAHRLWVANVARSDYSCAERAAPATAIASGQSLTYEVVLLHKNNGTAEFQGGHFHGLEFSGPDISRNPLPANPAVCGVTNGCAAEAANASWKPVGGDGLSIWRQSHLRRGGPQDRRAIRPGRRSARCNGIGDQTAGHGRGILSNAGRQAAMVAACGGNRLRPRPWFRNLAGPASADRTHAR